MTAHRWTASGRCSACAMHREWPGARTECQLKPTASMNPGRDRARAEKRASVAAEGACPPVLRGTTEWRERDTKRMRERRAEMGPEAVRAEWLRHQHAHRERLRQAREMSEAAE